MRGSISKLAEEELADAAPSDCALKALELMGRALALLDACQAPADAGAYLDHAMHRISEWIGGGSLK